MPDWAAFAGVATAVTLILVVLARASVGYVHLPSTAEIDWLNNLPDDADHLDAGQATPPETSKPEMSTGLLLANVAFSHGLFLVLLIAAALYTDIPTRAFGFAPSTRAVLLGAGFGLLLSVANTVAGIVAGALGHTPSKALRKLMAPNSVSGWVVLLGLILPLVALFEEMLFRGVLVGAFAMGFGVSPWLLAVISSTAFALGHGAQGRAGIAVTGTLGFILSAGFIVTGSLLVVIVAHYLVNAIEFVVYEGLSLELPRGG